MNKTSIKLKNCYGIPSLEYEFDFSQHTTYVIYAPNGVMKTSFAKTFKDLSKNQESKYGQTNEKYKEDSRKSSTAYRKPITYSRASNFGSKNEM